MSSSRASANVDAVLGRIDDTMLQFLAYIHMEYCGASTHSAMKNIGRHQSIYEHWSKRISQVTMLSVLPS